MKVIRHDEVRKKYEKPWLTKGIKHPCIKKNHLYKTFLARRSVSTETRYKTCKNKLSRILKRAKKNYYSNLLANQKNNIAGTWKTLKNILGRTRHMPHYPDHFNDNWAAITNKECIANMFNNFFVNVGPELSQKITAPANVSIYDYMGNRNAHSIFLTPVDGEEVIRTVQNCANKVSFDVDSISMKLIKQIITCVANQFTHICNASFRTGVFPDKMKIAKVVPLFKSGDKYICNNYRPISLLPQFSKVLEKLFSSRLDKFVNGCESYYGG